MHSTEQHGGAQPLTVTSLRQLELFISLDVTALTTLERLKSAFMTLNSVLRLPVCEDIAISNRAGERPRVFAARFSHCRRLLHFIACRVLGGNEGAEHAVKSCWRSASRNPPKFEHEGAFRSWLSEF